MQPMQGQQYGQPQMMVQPQMMQQPQMMMMQPGMAPLGSMGAPPPGVVTAGAHATLAFLSQAPGAS